MGSTGITMGTQNKTKCTRISNLGLPFRRYSMPETVMRKYSLKRQRSVQSPTEFGLPGTKDQGCQTDLSAFTPDSPTPALALALGGAVAKKPSASSHRLGTINEKMMMRCSRCNRSSERRHSYTCKYNIVCSKCKQTWRKTSLPVSIVSVSKGGETLRKTSDICRVVNKPLFQSGSSPENKIQFDIGKIIERSSDLESDVSREADNVDGDPYDRFPMEPNIESALSKLESIEGEDRLQDSEKCDQIEVENTGRTTTKMFEDRILKMLETYCPHMQCTLNMFMGSKRPHSEGSQRSQTSSDIKRPKSATGRLWSALGDSSAGGTHEDLERDGIGVETRLETDRDSGTQNILIIDHDNISSTENTPGSTTRECDSCHGSCPKCCSQEFSDAPHTYSCCCTSPDTTVEMKTSSGLTSSSGTLDQTVSDLSGSTQDSTLSITSVTPEDKGRLKTTSPLPIVLSSECILLTPIAPEQDDLDTTGSTQIEEANIETSDSPFPVVINSETTLMEPLEKGYISKKDMHNYSVHFLDSGHSDSSEEPKKGKRSQKVRIANGSKSLPPNGNAEEMPEGDSKVAAADTTVDDRIQEHAGLQLNQTQRDRRKSVCPSGLPGVSITSEKEKTEKGDSNFVTLDNKAASEHDDELTPDHQLAIPFCGTEKVNEFAQKKAETDAEVVPKKSSLDSGVRSNKADMSTQFPGDDVMDGREAKGAKTQENERRRNRREKRDAKLAEISDMVDDLEIREVPISSISATTYYEGLDEFLVPRFSAAPRSVSMFVNTSSEYSSDSDLSFADSLEDRLSPVPERQHGEFTRYDNRLVRGEVAEFRTECKHKRRLRKCYAYFVTLSGEQTNISVTTMPESIRNRLIMKEKQIRYLCRRKHSSRKVYCKRNVHRLCSKHRCKQKQTQTSPVNPQVEQKNAPEIKATVTSDPVTSDPVKSDPVTTEKTTACAGVQTAEEVTQKQCPNERESKVQNFDRIMIGFCANNVETSIYYSQDVTTVKKNDGASAQKAPGVTDGRDKAQSSAQTDSREDAAMDERICQILLAGLKEQENGHMVFVEETQTFYSKSNVKKISTSAQTTDGVKDSATLTDLTYDCQKSDKVANKVDLDSGSKKKLNALQKSEETLEKLQKINESLRKEIQETKLRCSQGTQVNLDTTIKVSEPESNGDSYGSLLNHSSNFKQSSFAEYRRSRQLDAPRNTTKPQPPRTNARPPSKAASKRSSNILGPKFRQKFEAIPEEKSSGSMESTEDSAEVTPRDRCDKEQYLSVNYARNGHGIRNRGDPRIGDARNRLDVKNGNDRNGYDSRSGGDSRSGDDTGNRNDARQQDVKICRSATDCRLTHDAFVTEARRHTVGNVVTSEPVTYERSTERRRNTYHGPLSVSEHTMVNTEQVKRAGNLNVNVSRRTGQIIGKRTSMMVGHFERVNGELKNGDAKRELDKYKGRAALETDEQEELLTLSRGWINFYLLRGDSQEVTAENGIHEEVFIRTPNTSPADYAEEQLKPHLGRAPAGDEEMGHGGHGQYTVHIHAAPESMRGNLKFPGVGPGPPARNNYSPPDEINLPDIASPPHSTPSSAASRSPLQPPRMDPQTLPSLALNLNGIRKLRKGRNGMPSLNPRDDRNARYDAELSPPNSPKSIMSRSGELACSEQSITSSSCGSESPKHRADKRWNNHRHRKDLNSNANNWTVTVAGNQEANTDVEMKLAFSHSQDMNKTVGSSTQQWTLTVNSGKRDRTVERHRDDAFQCLPDLDAHHHHHHHHQIHKKGWKHKEQTTTPSAEQLALLWPAVQEIIEKNALLQNSARLDPTWTPEKDEDVESKLSVTGWAITPEKKPRVPTQSERDLTRAHCPRHVKQRHFSFA